MPTPVKPDPELVRSLESQLAEAEKRIAVVLALWRQKIPDQAVITACRREFDEATALKTTLERRLAAAQGLAYLMPYELPVRPCAGAPLPHVLANEHKTFLTFYCNEADAGWDGTTVRIVSPSSGEKALLALVTFKRSIAHKLAGPNDEVWHGHPLYRRGFEGYSVQTVIDSPWVRELEAVNSVHPRHRPESWKTLTHYVFWFHDETFECVAEGLELTVSREPLGSLLARVAGAFTNE